MQKPNKAMKTLFFFFYRRNEVTKLKEVLVRTVNLA